MEEKGTSGKTNRGLASADAETRQRVARAGGEARHVKRGLQAADEKTRERVARAGGEAPHRLRGLQAADEKTRERVARAGGEASRGGGTTTRGASPESTRADERPAR